ncbi:MAG TPA: DUF2892 domain-containing protein [Demequina sp.]|nr:DUF2892 domain-containing protein [Demequina sp.]
MSALLNFLASQTGRYVRSGLGVILLVLAFVAGGAWAWVLGVLGVVFLLVGILDVCLLAPLFGKPLRGKEFRSGV